MSRLSTDRPFRCATCDADISSAPLIHLGLPFCCAGCVAGGPCICSYDEEGLDHDPARHETVHHARHAADATEGGAERREPALADDLRRLAPVGR
jgi:hypothetical protein